MPSPNQPPIATSAQPSVLLVEEYDALAAAIGSALKKFAPNYVTRPAATLADAEKVAAKTQPDLFIVDFDPSYTGLTAFLQKMRKGNPDARVLAMSGGIPPEIIALQRAAGAVQFVEKPYDIADFGASVQALLGPWTAIDASRSRGTLRSLGLADIVALQCAGGRSVIIDAKGSGGDSGEVRILNGQIVYAETDEQKGIDALAEMFNWPSPRVRETEKRVSGTRTIHGTWAKVFLEAWQLARPPEKTTEETPRPKTGKKIVVIDDTEMLLIFVDDALASADPELQISTASTGADGVALVKQVLPDLVLLDYSLPDINGDEVCRRLLQDKETARVPILMMSGHVAEMNVAAGKYRNIIQKIEKPFLSEAFVELVQRTLREPPRPPVVAPPKPAVTRIPAAPAPIAVQPFTPIEPAPEPARAPVIAAPGPAPTLPYEPAIIATRGVSRPAPVSAPVPAVEKNEVVLGLFLEVMSMQLTPELRMGTIRARTSSPVVSLHFLSAAAQGAIPTEIGFQLGSTDLNDRGQISVLRLVPTAAPFQPGKTRSAFEIGGVALVPGESRTRVQLTPAGTTPMTMELVANLEMGGVELSPTFQVAQLVLRWPARGVRIILNPKAPKQSGPAFVVSAVKLDQHGRIAELLLNPLKAA